LYKTTVSYICPLHVEELLKIITVLPDDGPIKPETCWCFYNIIVNFNATVCIYWFKL